MVIYRGFETQGILQRFWSSWYFRGFWNPWYFMGVLIPMLFYGGSKTHSILWRFQNPRYFTKVSKFMVINRGF